MSHPRSPQKTFYLVGKKVKFLICSVYLSYLQVSTDPLLICVSSLTNRDARSNTPLSSSEIEHLRLNGDKTDVRGDSSNKSMIIISESIVARLNPLPWFPLGRYIIPTSSTSRAECHASSGYTEQNAPTICTSDWNVVKTSQAESSCQCAALLYFRLVFLLLLKKKHPKTILALIAKLSLGYKLMLTVPDEPIEQSERRQKKKNHL